LRSHRDSAAAQMEVASRVADSMQTVFAQVMTELQSEHLASIDWQRGKCADAEGKYSRVYQLAGGRRQVQRFRCAFSSAGGLSRRRKGRPGEDVVATITSAHLSSWLHLASGIESGILAHSDEAHGVTTELSEGVLWGERDHLASEDCVQ
jgi:hypothetical protein